MDENCKRNLFKLYFAPGDSFAGTASYSEFLLTVMGGVNQLERDLTRMRQREDINLAKKEGKYRGRVQKYHAGHEGMNHAVQLYKEGNMTVKKICGITNVSRSALYRRLNKEG